MTIQRISPVIYVIRSSRKLATRTNISLTVIRERRVLSAGNAIKVLVPSKCVLCISELRISVLCIRVLCIRVLRIRVLCIRVLVSVFVREYNIRDHQRVDDL